MILQVYSVADKGVQAYMQPFFCRAKGEAIRSFSELLNDKTTMVAKYPAQFDLVYLGTYDDSLGRFDSVEPEHVVSALDFVAVDPDKEQPNLKRVG